MYVYSLAFLRYFNLSQTIEQDYVEMRKADPKKMTGQTLHHMLNLARFEPLSLNRFLCQLRFGMHQAVHAQHGRAKPDFACLGAHQAARAAG